MFSLCRCIILPLFSFFLSKNFRLLVVLQFSASCFIIVLIFVLHQAFYHLTQSGYTDTGPTSPRAGPLTPSAWQGSHWSATNKTRPGIIPLKTAGMEPHVCHSRGRRLGKRGSLLSNYLARLTALNRLVGLAVRRPPRERKIPGSNPACTGIFSGSSHTSDLKIDTPVATLSGPWRYRVSAGTGRPGVSIL